MTEFCALDPGFPGAGRVLKELSKVFPKVRYVAQDDRVPFSKIFGDAMMLFLPAWHPMYSEFFIRKPLKPVIVWTSPPLQSEMVPQELEYLRTILYFLDKGDIYALWLGDKNWLPLIKKEGRRVFYAPYPVSMPSKVSSKVAKHVINDVSLFGPLHPRKNVLTQLIAAKSAGVTVHTTDRSSYGDVMRALDIRYVQHGWLPEDQYERLLLEDIDLGLQVSLPGVESRSYVTWDHISRGIPCLSSVNWLPETLRIKAMADDPGYIAAQIKGVEEDPASLRTYAGSCSQEWNSRCREILERELEISLT